MAGASSRRDGGALTHPHADGNAPGAPADKDPVRALIAAERDGLLTYIGYSGDDRYEVVLADEERELPVAEVSPTVDRLRAIARMAAEGIAARLVSVTDEAYVLEIDERRRDLPAGQVVDWCAGYVAAHHGQGKEHAGEDHLGEIRPVLQTPSIIDQCRLVILGLMQGGEATMAMPELAEKVGRSKKTVIEALSFGRGLDPELADRMIAVFGLRWVVSAVGPEVVEPAEGGKATNLPQMPGIERLERILAAADSGWVRYVDEPSPNKARWARRYDLAVGERSYTVNADGLVAWLDGVAAFHGRDDRTERG